MAIHVEQLSAAQVSTLLALQEGHFAELKSKDIVPAKLTRTLSAFANASGGELYIGIFETGRGSNKTRRWQGFDDQEEANAFIQVFDGIFPLGHDIALVFLESKENPGLVLKAEVLKTRQIVHASEGIPYLRRGAKTCL